MIRAPFPDGSIAAAVIYYACVLVWVLSETRITNAHRGMTGRHEDGGTKARLLALFMTAILGANVLAFVSAARFGGWWSLLAGGALMLVGVAFRQWSVLTLGRFFTTAVEIQRDHRIIDNGPYAVVRHPSYLGGLTSIVGMGLALGNWAAIVFGTVVGAAGYIQRIVVEEKALRRDLGEPYERYAAAHRRLIPGVW